LVAYRIDSGRPGSTLGLAMESSNTPAGGQPANLRAGTPAIFNATAEAARLRKTLALAEEAIRCAADLRSARHAPGETAGESQDRWNDASAVEIAAKACRKAARHALAAVAVFRDILDPAEILAKIDAARRAALALQTACAVGQRNQNGRQIRLAARDLKRQIADCAAIEAGRAAEAERQKGGQS
jgi:hypothetical protein